MDFKSMVAILCSVLLVFAPVAESANSRAIARLSATGTAQVNGVVAPAGTSIFAGDRIVNADDSNTALSLTGGSRLILTGAGTLDLELSSSQPGAKLDMGRLAVLTRASAPITVEAAGTRITGGGGDAVYAVSVDGNNLQVTASMGRAEVEGAGRTVEVPEGKTLMAKMMPPEPRDPQGSASPGGSGGVSGLFTFKNIMIIAVVAGAATAVALAIRDLTKSCNGSTTVSPSTVPCH